MVKYNWKTRYLHHVLHDFKYIKVQNIDSRCVYCGERAEVLDHVPPISIAYQYTGSFLKIPACRSCNKYLYAIPLVTLSSRREHIRQRLYRIKDINIPTWENLEIAELKGMLNSYVKNGLKNQEIIRRRILYISINFEETFQDYIYDDYEKVTKKEG